MTSEQSNDAGPSELSTVSEDPSCRETPLTSLDSWITPTNRFYIRSHYSTLPDLDSSSCRLTVDGAVNGPITFSYHELLALPAKEIVATLECAGNSRSYVTPPAEGIQFRHGAVGNASWKGVPVRDLLRQAGVRESAREVLFEGADVGEEEEEGKALRLGFARSLPLDKAMDADTIVAYQMNGQPLQPMHGYPLRLIVPAWYAMASVKWLTRIEVLEERFTGFFQERRYVLINEGETESGRWQPLTTLRVKSLITHPRHGEVVRSGTYTVRGIAWSGDGEIARVDVSTDGGRSWREGRLVGPSARGAWRRWELPWETSRPGHFIVMARANDSGGNSQPTSIPWNFRGYANNGVHAVAVEVPPTGASDSGR